MSLRALPPIQIHRLQQLLRRLVCSAPWFDRCWSELADSRAKCLKRPENALDYSGTYPPGGRRRTAMRQCAQCRSRWYPPQYVRRCNGLCEDCAIALSLPPGSPTDHRSHVPSTQSATAKASHDLGYYRIRLIEARLPAEDEASLRREIAAAASVTSRNYTKNHDY